MTAPTTAPVRLAAPPPGWVVTADVIVVGSGVAGLTAALRCAEAGRRVVVVTKAELDDGSTRWAQGGIAAALGEGDSPAQHLEDTLVAGAGLCDEGAVHALVTEGPAAVRRLIATGAAFDTDPATGEIALTREGGHHRRRIAHAGGDATGAEISRALVAAVRRAGIETVEHALVLDLLKDADGRAAGVTLHVMGEGARDGVGAVRAPAVVLATGGMGQVFSATTNPSVSTGDGVALALRAGAEVSDLEFMQFHPTVMFLGADAEGQQPLVSEAVRGEGAHLVDAAGVRFMAGQHELAELAPRDIVAKAIMRRMREQAAEHMYLDARHFGAEMWKQRFPTILAACRAHGIDPVHDLIPVAPAAHYASGGVVTDLHGRTSVPGLYACGEVACTGVHGANRLASNSLLEGLVFAERIATDVSRPTDPAPPRNQDAAAATPCGEVRAVVPGAERGGEGSAPERESAGLALERESGCLAPERESAGLAPERESAGPVPGRGSGGLAPERGSGGSAPERESAGPVPGRGSGGPAPERGPGGGAPVGVSGAEPPSFGKGRGRGTPLVPATARHTIQRIMTTGVGVLRSATSLATATAALEAIRAEAEADAEADADADAKAEAATPAAADGPAGEATAPCVETWEATNLLLVARVLAEAARRRAETRGSHWREDHPDPDDARWRRHLLLTLRPDLTIAARTTADTAFSQETTP